ncbi:hypothetical protein BDP27DRAFT_1419939 [Rhodocollybia butyracea]|uniref:Uncharacterized protein n=1 Tax=Rhodocollybia butyracea TaxID=206335 RepID=A0A9P5U9Y0_9AGAR|nr:hypothetical protein BDP27DRAFT_1419939 [Rhodocollybia butyracea]
MNSTYTCFPVQFTLLARASIFLPYTWVAASRWIALADLYLRATQDTHESQVSGIGGHEIVPFQTGQEMVLFQIWAQPAFIAFLNAFEFHLQAIKAAVDPMDSTAVARELHDRNVQTLCDNIDKYRAFYKNAVKTEAFGEDAIRNVKALKRAIAVAGLLVSS